ncbi:MAG: hypothetical protein WCY37_04350 [Candidatus Dojkabacteria bacterium]
MKKTEIMKRYEAETGEIATWHWHDKEFVTDDYIAWLEAQLTWRPVSNSPKKDGEYFVMTAGGDIDKMRFNQGYWLIWGDEVSGYFLPMFPPRKWLPIPPAPDEDKKISHIGKDCGDCYHFMKSSECPKEVNVGGFNRGPSINSRACEKLEPESKYKNSPAPEDNQS